MRKEKLKTRVARSKESIPCVYWDIDYVDELDQISNMDFYLKFPPEEYFIEAIEYRFNKDWHLHSIKEKELNIKE